MARRDCRNAREFGDIFRAGVKSRGGLSWEWRRDLKPWFADMLRGVKFGDPSHDWSPEAADALAAEFIADASTW